jgi:hypothetical protein
MPTARIDFSDGKQTVASVIFTYSGDGDSGGRVRYLGDFGPYLKHHIERDAFVYSPNGGVDGIRPDSWTWLMGRAYAVRSSRAIPEFVSFRVSGKKPKSEPVADEFHPNVAY